jgi:hypothetical protein
MINAQKESSTLQENLLILYIRINAKTAVMPRCIAFIDTSKNYPSTAG